MQVQWPGWHLLCCDNTASYSLSSWEWRTGIHFPITKEIMTQKVAVVCWLFSVVVSFYILSDLQLRKTLVKFFVDEKLYKKLKTFVWKLYNICTWRRMLLTKWKVELASRGPRKGKEKCRVRHGSWGDRTHACGRYWWVCEPTEGEV